VLPLIELSGDNVRFLIFVLAPVALLLVAMACANITNIVLAQSTGRRYERAIRVALGASRLQQIRQSMLESFITSAAAGAVGVLLAQWGLAALRLFAGAENVIYTDLTVNARVLAASVLTAFTAPFVFALLPAVQSSRAHAVLNEFTRSASSGTRPGRARNVIVARQIALAMILLSRGRRL
jgi:putative ABC transport system permease protein